MPSAPPKKPFNNHVRYFSSPFSAQERGKLPTRDLPPINEEDLSACLRTIELELRRANEPAAKAAIARFFFACEEAKIYQQPKDLPDDSPLADSGLPLRVINLMEKHGVCTIGDARKHTYNSLLSIHTVSEKLAQDIMRAVGTDHKLERTRISKMCKCPVPAGDDDDED